MKDIKNFGKNLEDFYKRLEKNLMKAQEQTAEEVKKDVLKHLGTSSGKYANSIQQSKTIKEQDKIKTNIYTDLKSKDGYFIGRMIENGTGIYALEPHIGHTKTFHESNYRYWYVPASEVDRPIGKIVLIDGLEYYVAKAQKPKPHWKPALDDNIEKYKDNVKKAMKESL